MRLVVFGVLICLLGVSRFAEAQQLSPEYKKCMDVATTNYEFGQCSGAEITRQEQLLNDAWLKVLPRMKEYGPDAGHLLESEQKAWLTYKDVSCKFFSSDDPGTGAFGREGTVIHFGNCRARVIAMRTKELNDLLEFMKPR